MLGEPSDKGFSEGALHHGVIAAPAGRLPDLKGIGDSIVTELKIVRPQRCA